jgi:hypothetical protein
MKLKTIWTADIKDADEKENFTADVQTWIKTDVGQKFLSIMKRQLEQTIAGETKLENYDSPSWSSRQAHLNGYRQHVLQVMALFESEDR